MRSYTNNRDGCGNGADSDYINRGFSKQVELEFFDSQTVKVEQTTRGVRFHAKQFPSQQGWRWQTPNKELDPTVSVSKDVWVFISPNNPLVTTGLTDLVTNANVKALPGIWQAAQSVPAKNGDGKYNVPQIPYPPGAPLATITGTPLSGDLDQKQSGVPTVFWIYIAPYPSCT